MSSKKKASIASNDNGANITPPKTPNDYSLSSSLVFDSKRPSMNHSPGSELNQSLIYGDIDLSRLDLKRQQDIAALIMDKDKLILENSTQHRAILKDYELLLDAFTMKDLELKRTNQAYSELLSQLDQFKTKAKAQHEEVLSRLKDTEATLTDVVNYASSVVKFAELLYGQSIKACDSLRTGDMVDIEKEFHPIWNGVTRAIKPIEERYKLKPKRILVSLEQTVASYNHLKTHTDAEDIQEAYNIALARMSRPSFNIRPASLDETLRRLRDYLKSAKEQDNSDTIVAASKLFNDWLPFLMQSLPKHIKNVQENFTVDLSQYLATSDSLKKQLSGLLHDGQNMQGEFEDAIKTNQELKEKIAVANLNLDSLQRQVQEVAKQNEELSGVLKEQTNKSTETRELLNSETEELFKNQQSSSLRLKSLEKDRIKLAESTAKLKAEISQIEVAIRTLEQDNREMHEKIYSLEDLYQKDLSAERNLSRQFEEQQAELTRIESNRQLTKSRINDLGFKLNQMINSTAEVEKEYRNEQQKQEELENKIQTLRGDVNQAESVLKTSNNNVSRLQLEIDLLSQKLQQYKDKINQNENQMTILKKTLSDKQDELQANSTESPDFKGNINQPEAFSFGKQNTNNESTDTHNYAALIKLHKNMSMPDQLTNPILDQSSILKGNDVPVPISSKLLGETLDETLGIFENSLAKPEAEKRKLYLSISGLKNKFEALNREVNSLETQLEKLRDDEKELLRKTVSLEIRKEFLDVEVKRTRGSIQALQKKEIELKTLNKKSGSGSNELNRPLLNDNLSDQKYDVSRSPPQFFDYTFWRIAIAATFPLLIGYLLFRLNVL